MDSLVDYLTRDFETRGEFYSYFMNVASGRGLSNYDREDVYQGFFLKMLSVDFVPEDNLGFLKRSVGNYMIDFLRSKSRRVKREGCFVSEISYESPFEDACREERKGLFWGAVCRMPRIFIDCFIDRHISGMSYKEIALKNGLSVSSVDYRIHQGRKEFAACFAEVKQLD
jgi:DNA-directed RNA polymerase specialized sigma24 family protein